MSAQGIRCTDFHIVNKVFLCNLYPAVLRGSHRWPVFPRSGWPVRDWELVCHLWFWVYWDKRLWLLQGGARVSMDLNHTETQRVIRVLLYVTDPCHWCVHFVAARKIHNPKKSKPGQNIWLSLLWILIFIWKKAFCKKVVGLLCFALVFHLEVLHMPLFWWTEVWLMFSELILAMKAYQSFIGEGNGNAVVLIHITSNTKRKQTTVGSLIWCLGWS